ncbi:nitrite reductase large subunit NirB [Nocardioides dubius]|uniref:assimilatory sulfite reductase (ferredoxin) n=1 Tax=Nocardioides dubius TaxID=317019 RepID=A0ABN1U3M9_9ACTN
MSHTRKTLVVVGHGMVGHRFVQAAIERGVTERWDLVVIGEEPRPAYDRVALTSFFEVGADQLSFLPDGAYADPRVRLLLDTAVCGIDREARTVTLSNDEVLHFDGLVLATGAGPFVPPIPGKDLAGTFVYRTIEDLEAIREAAGNAKVGAVIGGGLLGLEAANALVQLGLETHVVEMAPRLMPVQLDQPAGMTLVRHIEKLGVTVHAGAATSEVIDAGDGTVAGLGLKDADAIPAEVVVFSAGIRPRDQLARDCGLEVAERGGILVDTQCRTSDPAIFAIGECAAPGGRMYGLVAPGYAMAEVAADALLGGPGEFLGADMSTKLKLLGVDVASFGDAFGATEGSLELVFADAVAGIYKKLVVVEGDDGAYRLLGGILVGDASAYGVLRPMVASGMALPDNPEELILPAAREGAPQLGLPDEAVVCSCNNVTKASITASLDGEEHACADVACVKSCTKAGSTCGSCVPVVKNIIEQHFAAQGKVVDKGICEHFAHTRQELFDLVLVHRYRTFDEIVTAHGRGRGCDICKPTVASILASQFNGHVLGAETGTLQDTNDAYLANLQKNGTYSVVPRIPGGEITPEKLIVIGEVARDYGLYTKITGGQRIDLFGARMEQLPAIWTRLVDAGFESGHAYGKSLRTVKSCVGSSWCRFGVQDSVQLAIDLELRYRGLRSPHKLKGGVSGCARECAEARGKDFGVIATEKGWNLYVCGNGGATPAHAQLLAADLSTEELIRCLDRFLMYYIRTADRLQRTSAWLDTIDGGLARVREIVVDDALGLGAELEAAMAEHVGSYFDEWRATLEDPAKLARFVSFVNAPDTPDPSITFAEERGQISAALTDGPVQLGATIPVGAP